MSVTIIIVNWNSGRSLAECLWRVMTQTVQPERVLVVDNASTDGSLSGIDSFSEKITLLSMTANMGFAVGSNRALARCATEFVALLNPDVIPKDDWLERLLIAARAHPEAAAFGSRQLCRDDPDIIDGIGDIYHISGLAWRNRYGMRQRARDLAPREIFSPCAAAALYRRQAIDDIGGFDENFFCYMEDVDMGFRLRLAGHNAVYVPDAVVYHSGSAATGGQLSDFAVYHGFRNQVWTFVKNMPGVLFWPLLPIHIIVNLMTIFIFTIRGQGKVIFKSKKDAFLGIPEMWRRRRDIQTGCVVSAYAIWKALDKRIFIPVQARHFRRNWDRLNR